MPRPIAFEDMQAIAGRHFEIEDMVGHVHGFKRTRGRRATSAGTFLAFPVRNSSSVCRSANVWRNLTI